jgi:hypothetical protein
MNEYILFVFHFNKPKALLIAEPLDSTFAIPASLEHPICKLLYSAGSYKKTAKREIPLWLICRFVQNAPQLTLLLEKSISLQKARNLSGRLWYFILLIKIRFIVFIRAVIF